MTFPPGYCLEKVMSTIHKFGYSLSRGTESFTILMPEYFIDFVKADIRAYSVNQMINFTESLKVRGIEVRAGYENKIIIFHKNYPLYQAPELYIEVPLCE